MLVVYSKRTLCGVYTLKERQYTHFSMNGSDKQITVTAVAESNSDVPFSRARAPNFKETSRVPPNIQQQFVNVVVPSNIAGENSPSLCCTIPMGSTSRYSSYNCLTSWDSYDRIPRIGLNEMNTE
ncbi:hypothetical protein PGB90_001334 [Kerria lacca]